MSLTLTSTAFQHDGEIPAKYTCEGDDISPALSWVEVPGGAATLALIVDDPDAPDPKAPKMTWVHYFENGRGRMALRCEKCGAMKFRSEL